jgi:uncharacterized membrane protein
VPKPFSPLLKWLGIGLALMGMVALLFATPGGLLRKTDYIAAAVCHRRLSHSFEVAGRQLPLCQRCTGTFPGALTGILVHLGLWRRRRSIAFPKWPFLLILILFAALWGLDGVNSTTSDGQFHWLLRSFISRPAGVGLLGYAPQPWLRLLSGTLMGMSMSVILVPAFNQSMWADGEETRTLRSWREIGQLLAIELAMASLITLLEALPYRGGLYAISIYSALAVLAMFTLLGAMMFVLLTRRDVGLRGWRDAWIPLIWGIVFAALVIAVMDGARLWLTGTIDGVPGLD